ncbi:MAG TPA: DUF4010 domain-containing protein, partial [Candidatus Nitrosocosmicus sp.]|nr:DUF4010 domain-containing protein [Candidatus Nitrosocosmicus sp.]
KVPKAVLGVRRFSLMTMLGAVTGFMYIKFAPLALIITAAFFIVLFIFYYLDSHSTKDYGVTTEIAALYSFIIGLLLSLNILPLQITIAVTTVVILLLSQKDKIKDVVEDIGRKELNAFIVYAILALVIMPFLPNTSYSISDFKGLNEFLKNIGLPLKNIANVDLFNPFKTWLILVLITGIDVASYILGRIIGAKKSWFITSMLGGLISSTAATQAIAQQSKHISKYNYLVAAAILANLASFFQIAAIIGVVNGAFLTRLIVILLLMTVMSAVLFIFFLKIKDKGKANKQNQLENQTKIINLSGALKFAGLYLGISIASKIALALFGNTGLLVATSIGAMIGLDAVMINISQLAGGKVDYNIAVLAFILANAINLIAKSIYTFIMGTREFAIKFSISMIIIIITSIVGYLGLTLL